MEPWQAGPPPALRRLVDGCLNQLIAHRIGYVQQLDALAAEVELRAWWEAHADASWQDAEGGAALYDVDALLAVLTERADDAAAALLAAGRGEHPDSWRDE